MGTANTMLVSISDPTLALTGKNGCLSKYANHVRNAESRKSGDTLDEQH